MRLLPEARPGPEAVGPWFPLHLSGELLHWRSELPQAVRLPLERLQLRANAHHQEAEAVGRCPLPKLVSQCVIAARGRPLQVLAQACERAGELLVLLSAR
eukprot:50766-Alexandrium_andersonii.AAC.1